MSNPNPPARRVTGCGGGWRPTLAPMPAQVSGILLVAVFAVVAVAGTVLAWRLVALSAPSIRQPPGRKSGRGAAAAAPEEPDGTP